jgi:hypothetical protein
MFMRMIRTRRRLALGVALAIGTILTLGLTHLAAAKPARISGSAVRPMLMQRDLDAARRAASLGLPNTGRHHVVVKATLSTVGAYRRTFLADLKGGRFTPGNDSEEVIVVAVSGDLSGLASSMHRDPLADVPQPVSELVVIDRASQALISRTIYTRHPDGSLPKSAPKDIATLGPVVPINLG